MSKQDDQDVLSKSLNAGATESEDCAHASTSPYQSPSDSSSSHKGKDKVAASTARKRQGSSDRSKAKKPAIVTHDAVLEASQKAAAEARAKAEKSVDSGSSASKSSDEESATPQDAEGKKLVDITKLDARVMSVRWYQYPLREFLFDDLHLYFCPNANIKQARLVIDVDGRLLIRAHPDVTWWNIAQIIAHNYKWFVDHQQEMQRTYDTVSYLAQKQRTFKENDLIYVWGLPYFLHVETGADEERLEFTKPQQVILGRVPYGTSRYTERFHALARKGYLNPEALRSLPWVIEGRLVLPKHCQWHDIKHLNMPLQIGSEINIYYSEFARTMQQTLDDWQQQKLFGSRFLSDPSRQMCLRLFYEYYHDFLLKNPKPRLNDWLSVETNVENRLNSMDKGIFTGSIVCEPHHRLYLLDPLLSPEQDKVLVQEPLLSFNIGENLKSAVGIRTEVPPAHLSSAPVMHYYEMPDEFRLSDLIWQRALFALGDSPAALQAKERGLYQDLRGNETSLFTLDGCEIDPALAVIAYLPDDPSVANTEPEELNLKQVERLAGGTFVDLEATKFIAKHYQRQNMPYFHRTLVKPGVLTLHMRSSKHATEEMIKKALTRLLDQEQERAAQHYLKLVKPLYQERLAIALRAMPMSQPNLGFGRWIDHLEVRKMKPLGQYRWHQGRSDIRLNRRLVHYPISVMASILNHELCHMPFPNHSKNFQTILFLHCPAADAISDSIVRLAILPL